MLALLACASPPPPPPTVETIAAGWFGTDAGAARSADSLRGRVVTVAGAPIPGATVTLYWNPPEPLATAVAAADGTWHMRFAPEWENRGLTLGATAAGYTPWIAVGAVDDLPARVRLTRPLEQIDAALPTASGAARLQLVVELLAAPRHFVDLDGDIDTDEARTLFGVRSRAEDHLFTLTGTLLPELRTLVDEPAFARPDSPADAAREALAEWGDPADEARVEALPRRRRARPLDLSAATPDALCQRYVAWHVEREQGQVEGTCHVATVDPTGTRARFELDLGYPDGASGYLVVAHRAGDTWTVADHRETRHASFGR